MNLTEAGRRCGLKENTLRNYLKRRRPILKAQVIVENGRRRHDVSEEDFAAWQEKMQARKPFGANLHRSRKESEK